MNKSFIILDLIIQLGFLSLFTGIATFLLMFFPSGNLAIMSMLLVVVLGTTRIILNSIASVEEDL